MNILFYCVGFTAQVLFFARFLIQWLLSEKAKQVLSPAIFWKLSLIASFLLYIYGFLRDDFAIILGQTITYYIYIWNLNMQKNWKKISLVLRLIFLFMPLVVTIYMIINWRESIQNLFLNEEIPLLLLLWGTVGQLIFTFRFVYQWIYSLRRKISVLPEGFWIISLIGSSIIFVYAIFRRDPVLMLGQGLGFFIYTRNLILLKNRI